MCNQHAQTEIKVLIVQKHDLVRDIPQPILHSNTIIISIEEVPLLLFPIVPNLGTGPTICSKINLRGQNEIREVRYEEKDICYTKLSKLWSDYAECLKPMTYVLFQHPRVKDVSPQRVHKNVQANIGIIGVNMEGR